MPTLDRQLDVVVKDASVGLLDAYGIAISLHSQDVISRVKTDFRAGVIGFSGEHLKGSVSLQIDDETLKKIGSPSYDLNDWVAELSNQLLGRIKNKLLRFDVIIGPSTPIAVTGEQLQMTFKSQKAHVLEFRGDSGNEKIVVYVDAEVEPNFEVREIDGGDKESPIAEGETVIF